MTARPHGHITPYLRCQLPRVRALINAAADNDDGVERDFVAAAKALREFGASYWLGRTLLDHAEWLIARGREIQAPVLAADASHTRGAPREALARVRHRGHLGYARPR
ncbi:MAG: hypothetical protein ABI775_09560 [Pseudonocardiales bacterium]